MNFLEERIIKDGVVKEGNVLKVDSFLNHQMDISLMEEIGREFKRRFADKKVTKVMTIEASGIGIACFVAKEFGVPMVFAKKSKSINIDGDMYVADVESFTHKNKNQPLQSASVGKKVVDDENLVARAEKVLGNDDVVDAAMGVAFHLGCPDIAGNVLGLALFGKNKRTPELLRCNTSDAYAGCLNGKNLIYAATLIKAQPFPGHFLKQRDVHLMIEKAVNLQHIVRLYDSVFQNAFFQKIHNMYLRCFLYRWPVSGEATICLPGNKAGPGTAAAACLSGFAERR